MVLRLTCLASAMVAPMVALATGAAAAQAPPAQPVPQAPPTGPTPAAPPAPATTPETDLKDKILLQADVIIEDRNTLITTAEGNVEVRVNGKVLRTDRLIFDQNKQSMRAQGRVQIVDEDGTVEYADELEGDEGFRNGFATGFSTRLGGNSIATASSAIRTDGTKNVLEQVVYTGCKVCADGKDDPTWQLRARRAMLDQDEQMISYQDAVLEIKGIPIFYIPYFAHADPNSKRRSGFLTPDGGVSSKIGIFYEQPYYFALSPSQDLTVAPMVSQEVRPLLKVDYRKRFFSGFVDLRSSVTYEREFDSDGQKLGEDTWRSHLYGAGLFNINTDWKWGFGIERQTDDLYDRRYDIDGEDDLRGLFASQSRQLLTQLYTVGQTPDFYLEAGGYLFQGLREQDVDARFPHVAPSLFTEKVLDFGAAGQLALDFSAVGLFRDEVETRPPPDPSNPLVLGEQLLDTIRTTASANWETQLVVGPGLLVEPFAQGRGDYYAYDRGDAAGKQEVPRFLGLAGAQVSYPFIRRGKTMDIVIEPVVMVAYGTPKANEDGVPNEDSLVFEADESNLFRPNPNTSYDLWEGGARAAAGVNASAQIGKDTKVSLLFGRRWREAADPAFNELSNLRTEKSDYVAAVKLDLGPFLSLGSRTRLDDSFNVNRIDLDTQFNFGFAGGGLRYYKLAENAQGLKDEGVAWSGRYKITENLYLQGLQSRNISAKEDLRLLLGLAYQDDCAYFAISYERQGGRDRTLGPSESIHFDFVLTGLGGASDQNFD